MTREESHQEHENAVNAAQRDPQDALVIWAIFDGPDDQPDCFVARKFLYDQPTDEKLTAPTLSEIRRLLPPGLYRMDRDPSDHPNVVETWF